MSPVRDGLPDASQARALASRRVLLVDDDPALRAVVRRILGARRYTIIEAETAEQAWTLVRSSHERFDLVISDVVMAGGDGYELVSQLCGLVGATILMSGYPVSPNKLQPDVGFVQKPFTPQQLRDCVARVLDTDGAR